jgi:hypothetical protein
MHLAYGWATHWDMHLAYGGLQLGHELVMMLYIIDDL